MKDIGLRCATDVQQPIDPFCRLDNGRQHRRMIQRKRHRPGLGGERVDNGPPANGCTFRMAGVDRRTGPFTDVELCSGDILVFGGVNRRIYHGVPKLALGSAPGWLDLPPGRLSITVRETGLE